MLYNTYRYGVRLQYHETRGGGSNIIFETPDKRKRSIDEDDDDDSVYLNGDKVNFAVLRDKNLSPEEKQFLMFLNNSSDDDQESQKKCGSESPESTFSFACHHGPDVGCSNCVIDSTAFVLTSAVYSEGTLLSEVKSFIVPGSKEIVLPFDENNSDTTI